METHSAAHLRHRLEEIDSETAFLHTRIGELADARRTVVAQLKRVRYPILRLPPEITCKIFLERTRDEAIDLGSEQLNGPFVIASVCKRWRALALRQHELWTRIYARCDLSVEVFHERLKLCLERSGPLAGLDLDFDRLAGQWDALPLLLPIASQWSRLEMYLDDPERLEAISGRLTRLQVLKLHAFSDGDASPTVAFREAPMLREVELFDLDATKVSLPWAQLSTLYLQTGHWVQCDPYAMLQQTPNLETLLLSITGSILPSESAILEIRLGRLRHLTLHWSSSDGRTAITFANLLTVPALVDLTIDIEEELEFAHALKDMLTRSRRGEEMRSLTLKLLGNRHYTGYIDHILSSLARLDVLTVAGVGWNQLAPVFDVFGRPLQPTTPLSTKVRELSIELDQYIPYSNLVWLVSELEEDRPDFRRSRPRVEEEEGQISAALERLRRVPGFGCDRDQLGQLSSAASLHPLGLKSSKKRGNFVAVNRLSDGENRRQRTLDIVPEGSSIESSHNVGSETHQLSP
ncbi:hypothetical protein C8F01DRAFT_1165263 [Mycena amicta]|nr:hypothetical protein C8F01DRAFT_1165263 [Mycena amicta]